METKTAALNAMNNHTKQRGAALYVALVLLVVLALLGIITMKVITSQEVMTSSNAKRAMAFENAEGSARILENKIDDEVNKQNKIYAVDDDNCEAAFDPMAWSIGKGGADAVYVRKIDKCYTASASSLVLGKKANNEGNTNNVYEITVTTGNKSTNAESVAVINTVFIP